jgi:hypothetical protein
MHTNHNEETAMTVDAEFFKSYTVYTLANLADCGSPDSNVSAGAEFLRSIADNMPDVMERIENGEDAHDVASKIADEAPDYHTYTRWQEFADLAAWQEDITELGEPSPDDLTKSVAGVALYIIAERLVNALIEEARSQEEDNDNDEEVNDDPSFTVWGEEDDPTMRPVNNDDTMAPTANYTIRPA